MRMKMKLQKQNLLYVTFPFDSSRIAFPKNRSFSQILKDEVKSNQGHTLTF